MLNPSSRHIPVGLVIFFGHLVLSALRSDLVYNFTSGQALVGGWPTHLKNIIQICILMVGTYLYIPFWKVIGWWLVVIIPFIYGKRKHVPNHQTVHILGTCWPAANIKSIMKLCRNMTAVCCILALLFFFTCRWTQRASGANKVTRKHAAFVPQQVKQWTDCSCIHSEPFPSLVMDARFLCLAAVDGCFLQKGPRRDEVTRERRFEMQKKMRDMWPVEKLSLRSTEGFAAPYGHSLLYHSIVCIYIYNFYTYIYYMVSLLLHLGTPTALNFSHSLT